MLLDSPPISEQFQAKETSLKEMLLSSALTEQKSSKICHVFIIWFMHQKGVANDLLKNGC